MWYDTAEQNRQLDALERSGARIVRIDVGWASLQEGGPGTYADYHVDRLDRVVAGAAARGIKPLLTLMETPCWASIAPESLKRGCEGQWWSRGVQKYGPADPQDYARAAAWVAARYAGRLAGLELWNEPNHPDFFLGPDRAGRYAALVRAAYPAIKAVAPDVTVVAGSLSEADVPFMRELYRHGIRGHYDGFAVHPYSHDASPSDTRERFSERTSFIRGVPAVRAAQLAAGDTTPLWLTESGWSTSTVRSEPWASGIDERDQGRYLEEQAAIVRRWDYVAANIWFNLKDTTSDRSDLVGNYGLLRRDGSEKPAFASFKRAAAMLNGWAPAPSAPPADPPAGTPSGPSAPASSGPSGSGSTPAPGPKPPTSAAAPVGPAPVAPAGAALRPVGLPHPAAPSPLRLRISRKDRRLVVSGTVPSNTTQVTVAVYRTAGGKTAKRASYRVSAKLGAALAARRSETVRRRTFRSTLPKRLAGRGWKIVATAHVGRSRKLLRAEASADPRRSTTLRPFAAR